MSYKWNSSSKYKAKKVQYDNFSFASKLEAAVYQILKLRELAGEIENLRCQETIYLTKAEIVYKPDFSFTIENMKWYAEAKGLSTASFNIKKRLWEYYGPGPLEIYKGTYQRPFLVETIIPKID